MAIHPEIIAGYEAARHLLADTGVTISALGSLPAVPTGAAGLVAASSGSVEAVAVREGIRLLANDRFGLDGPAETVPYPTGHDHPEFTARLGEVLLPKVAEFQAWAAEAAR